MNIHFKDKKLLKQLESNTISTFIVGSKLYGSDNENSDIDTLSIYLDNIPSFMWEHHQLQFKEEDKDLNFTTLQTFIRNILTGDATINLEVLFSRQIEGSVLSFLYNFRKEFINYNIIKSYLGMAKRDMVLYKKNKSPKKLGHIFRGICFAKQLMMGDLDVEMNTYTYDVNIKDIDILKSILDGKNDDLLADLIDDMNKLRIELNETLTRKRIHRYMNPDILKEIDLEVKKLYSYSEVLEIDYGDLFYDVLENGVKY